ncbi:MFS transporter [Microbacterium sp. NPDC077663]|uniref:MFS transporter n=1 Tax=Microbacterium sp. NPDC077663 TaxID=3364189 RepID=UPI0037C9CC10
MTQAATAARNGRQPAVAWWSTFIGGVIENYDFAIYAAASATILGPLFFSKATPEIAVVLSFMTLAIGYAARPIGAILFGHIGDRVGRKSTMIMTLIIMAIATVLVGFLPTAAEIGDAAPIFLIVLRLLQGVAVGGEWGGGVALATEHATAKRRALFGASTSSGAAMGFAVGYGVFALVAWITGDELVTWGWRIPFWSAAILFVFAIWMRLRVQESPLMKGVLADGSQKVRVPLGVVLRYHWRAVLIGLAFAGGELGFQQVMQGFAVSYGTSTLGFPTAAVLVATTIPTAINACLIPFAGMLADRFGRRKVMLVALSLQLVNAVIVWPLIGTGVYLLFFLAFLSVYCVHAFAYSPQAGLLTEMFPTNVRYTGISVAYQIGALIGGLGPLISSAIYAAGGGILGVALVMAGFVVMGLVGGFFAPRRKDIDLAAAGERNVVPAGETVSTA